MTATRPMCASTYTKVLGIRKAPPEGASSDVLEQAKRLYGGGSKEAKEKEPVQCHGSTDE